MKLSLLLFLLPFTTLAQSKEVETEKQNAQLLVDSLEIVTRRQAKEIELLSEELLKSIAQRGMPPAPLSERTILRDISLDGLSSTETAVQLVFKLWVNDAGKVVLLELQDGSTTNDAQLIQEISRRIKENLRYNTLQNAALQGVYYTVKIAGK